MIAKTRRINQRSELVQKHRVWWVVAVPLLDLRALTCLVPANATQYDCIFTFKGNIALCRCATTHPNLFMFFVCTLRCVLSFFFFFILSSFLFHTESSHVYIAQYLAQNAQLRVGWIVSASAFSIIAEMVVFLCFMCAWEIRGKYAKS